MSHFNVLVIGDDIETQLAPYDENAEVEAYQDPDYNYAEALARAKNFYALNPEFIKSQGVDLSDDRATLTAYMGGDDIRFDENGVSSRWTTYNPQSKWDWWVTGGRYNTSFKIKQGADPADYVPSEGHWTDSHKKPRPDFLRASDRARKGAIDFPAMVAKARASAEAEWAEYERETAGLTPPDAPWATFRERFENPQDARSAWHGHEWVKAIRPLPGFWADDNHAYYHVGEDNAREAFLANAEAHARAPYYAVVKDGEWIARGDVGWWGLTSNEVPEAEWRAKVGELIESLDDDVWLTTVDCHI